MHTGRICYSSAMHPQTLKCKICGHDATFSAAADFSLNCARMPLPLTGELIPYHHCAECGFLFTAAFDGWTSEQLRERIYNEDYARIDYEFSSTRPLRQAEDLARILEPLRGKIRILDYGGGNGVFARRMGELGFDTVSYDPFFGAALAGERFELIHCREVIEHTTDPRGFVADLLGHLADDGAVYLSTAVQPEGVAERPLDWWYLGPRNGHISLFSKRSLARLWMDQGVDFGHFSEFVHMASRGQPPCLPLLMERGGA